MVKKNKVESNLYVEAIKDYITKNPDKASNFLADQMNDLFGFRISNKSIEDKEDKLKSFAPPENMDGAALTGYSAFNAQYVDFNGQRSGDEIRMIDRYREMSITPECETAIDDILNEMISIDDSTPPITIVLDEVKLEDKTKDKIRKEFEKVLDLFEFKQFGYDIIRKWYVDGRMYYHLMIDPKAPEKGIQEVRYVDPRKIKKVKENPQDEDTTQKNKVGSVQLYKKFKEYYIYSENGFDMAMSSNVGGGSGIQQAQGLRIAKDNIAYTHSGLLDPKTGVVMSHLQKAIKPFNQLRMMEDSTVIYRISRAAERRIFYIDVGGIPPPVAERYVATVADRFKNKLSYDVSTGEITNDRRFMTMLEDFFLAQREGKGTQVDTLSGGQSLGVLDDVEYFRRKLYKALNVPITRLESETAFNLGRPQEITRDEIKFSKFIQRLRNKFVLLFEQALQKQLILKKIITSGQWENIRQDIFYNFKEDNHFAELRDSEILANRLGILSQIHTYTTKEGGGYFSKNWIKKMVLRQTEDEIKEMQKEIDKEEKEMVKAGINPNATTGVGGFGMGDMGSMGGMDQMGMGGPGMGGPQPQPDNMDMVGPNDKIVNDPSERQ